jgi:predicted dehydrogenase
MVLPLTVSSPSASRSPLRAALLGCGSYGATHAAYLSAAEDVELVAVADLDPARAANFQARFGAARAATDPAELWAATDIDLVWICTPHDTHAPLAEQATAAGKAFFLEKPLAITMADCARIVAATERAGVFAAVGFKLRFFPAVVAARAWMQRPAFTQAHVIDDHWPVGFWANDPVKGGGNVLSQGCHMVDTVLHLHPAPPVRVYAAGGNRFHPGREIVDTAAITLTFADESVATIAVGDVGVPPHASKFALQAADGARSLSLFDRMNALQTRAEGVVIAHGPWPEEGAAVIDRACIDVWRAGGPSPAGVRSAWRTSAVVLAAVESIRRGAPVDLREAPWAQAWEGAA